MDIIPLLRQFRILNYAVFDLTLAFLGIFLVAPLLSKIFRKIGLEIPKRSWLFLVLPISIVVHLLVGQMTPMTRNFLDLDGHYLLKTVIIGLFILGMTGIKKAGKD